MLRRRNIVMENAADLIKGLINGPNEAEEQRLASMSRRRFALIYIRSIFLIIVLAILIWSGWNADTFFKLLTMQYNLTDTL